MRRAPASVRESLGVRPGSAACEAIRATSSPSRSTRTTAPGRSSTEDTSTVTPPARTAVWTPGSCDTRSTPLAVTRWTCTSPSSASAAPSPAEADTRTSSSPTSSTARRCSRASVRVRPPTARARAPLSSVIRTSSPPGLQQGVAANNSSHVGSFSRSTVLVAPVSGSTASVSCVRWSRLCTRISGEPAADQCTRARYGNASRSQRTSVRLPSRSRANNCTSALGVPAAGYACARGSLSGFAGSAIHHRRTGASSYRATSSRSDPGAHQKPRSRPISSAATNSASPYATVPDSGSASARSPSPSAPTTLSAPPAA